MDDLVAEVDGALAGHQLLVLRVRRGQLELLGGPVGQGLVVRRRRGFGAQLLGARPVLLRRDVLVLAAADQRDQRLQMARGIAERPVALEGQLEEPVAEEDDLLGAAQHAEVGRETQLERVLAQQPVAEGVEGGDVDVGVPVGHELVDALLHLGRRLVGEREREDLLGAGLALGDEPGDAAGDDGGLAGAGAGDDEQRARVVGDGLALCVVEAVEDPSPAML